MDSFKINELKKQMELAINEPNKGKQRKMVQEIMNSPEMYQFKKVIQKLWEYVAEFVKILIESIRQIARVIKKYQRSNSFKRQRIKHKGRVLKMANRKKRKLKKAINKRAKKFEKDRVKAAWRNIFVKRGILK